MAVAKFLPTLQNKIKLSHVLKKTRKIQKSGH
jgi:hypothetical protein